MRRALQDLGGLLQDHQPDLYATWALQAQRRMRARGARLTVIAGARIPLRPDGTLNRASHDQLRAHGAHSWRVDRPDSTYHAPHPVEAGIDQLPAHEHEHHLRNRDQLPDLWWQVELALHARPGRPSRPRTADAYRARP
ncbi:hypothetical protein GKE82_23565 [Conexibacter sp. W3-3-2]|uniref:hypothetical protein n=1 Tax=Conexibacter sp. W3-3-2 TaxID=2675227 RepID=UPI0012B8BFAB|nr:hypothetical protein [Conexibacter sp. W3-3-2]MTD47184.1 hypothetical protein [Conexibacter sp. W3-3-2]